MLGALAAQGLGCGGGSGGGSGPGGLTGEMTLVEAGNGFGQLLPHQAHELGAGGVPGANLVELRSIDDLLAHVTPGNPVVAPTPWPAAAVLPGGAAGNHYLFARTKLPIDAEAAFASAGIVVVRAIDGDGNVASVPGRLFIGGYTMNDLGELERWVAPTGGGLATPKDVDGDGSDDYAVAPGIGFPGTQSSLAGAEMLADSRTLVFVADADDDLATPDAFPLGTQMQMQLTSGLKALGGKHLKQAALASAAVGPDAVQPEIMSTGGMPEIVPGNGDLDVDPQTDVVVRFTEPVQPWTVGPLPDGSPATLSAAIQLQFGPEIKTAKVPFHALPQSVFDLSRYALSPSYAFPGSGPDDASCSIFGRVDVLVASDAVEDLAGNRNTDTADTWFMTGTGVGIVNAPIAPEAIYVGRGGASATMSIIDTNGFGWGTGNPDFDPSCKWKEGHSNAKNDPNVIFQAPQLIPSLPAGACTFDGGSSGPFTLTRDSNLDDRLVQADTLLSISDMALGHSLDEVYFNGSPFGCQAGGGNLCASTSYKRATFTISSTSSITLEGFGNLLQFAPHPNPPPISYPPICAEPYLAAQEPTSVDSIAIHGITNMLVPTSQTFGDPSTCSPPSGIPGPTQHAYINFGGPSLNGAATGNCPDFSVRQQIGHFLYVADRVAGEVVVLNSNRMNVIDRIQMPDPTSFAMSPNLNLLAVSSFGSNSVRFIDINPGSTQFHSVVKTVPVGAGPSGIAWEPGNEDILVCNTLSNSVSVISTAGLAVRKTLSNQLASPIDVAITPRQLGIGMQRYVYFAYVLNANGTVSVFESGPDGVNGWGYDEIIGVLPMKFREPRAIQPDPHNLNSGFWVAHQDQLGADGQPTGLGGGAITNVAIVGGTMGVIPLGLAFADPSIRDLQWGVRASIGSDQLTGIPVDIAFDDWTNFTTYPNFTTPFSNGSAKNYNAKGMVNQIPGGGITVANSPTTLYAAVPVSTQGQGAVDVFDISSAGNLRMDVNPFQPGVQSIDAPGAQVLMHYFRQ